MSVVFSGGVVTYDIETHSIDEMGTMPPEEYFKIAGYAVDEGPVRFTEDLGELRRVLLRARMLIGANILSFDLPAVFGDTMVGVKLARAGRVYDTHVSSLTANPPPFGTFLPYTGGKPQRCVDPPEFRKWIKLDQQAFSLGVPGKTADLKTLTDRYMYTYEPILTKSGKPSMSKGEPRMKKVPIPGICCQFGAIPNDDSDFRDYLEGDVLAAREVARKLLEREPYSPYVRREMTKVACAVQIGRGNGLRVDIPATIQRAKDLHEEAAWELDWLRDTHGMPMAGKKPLGTKEGKVALLAALASVGIPESALPRTAPTEAHPDGQPSFSADNILAVTVGKGEAAEKLGQAVATLAGQRSLAELLLTEVKPDGKVHPDIFPLQRSGRFSTTKPGLTIWDPRFKDLLIADDDTEVLVEFDYSAADARAVAAMSGDPEFAKRFEDGADTHMMTAIVAWGAEKVAEDPRGWRQKAKAPGHGWGYKMGARKMAQTTGLPEAECKQIIKRLNAAYPGVVAWQKRVTSIAQRYGYVINQWGRKMVVEPDREFTQTPALFGQGATHEILNDGILACDDRHLRMLKVTIHDAFLASIPIATLDEDIAYFQEKFSTVWHPPGGQAIEFTLAHGTPARDWASAQHD